MSGKDNPERRRELAAILERQRRELSERPDVSQRMRELSASGTGNPRPPVKGGRLPRRTLAMAVGTGLVLSLLVFALVVVLVTRIFFQNQIGSPTQIAQEYYAALHQEDLARAYSYFSPAAQAKVSQDAFITQEQGFEQVEGVVETYTTTATTTTGSTAVVKEQITRSNSDHSETDTLNMVQQNGTWYISSIVIPAATK